MEEGIVFRRHAKIERFAVIRSAHGAADPASAGIDQHFRLEVRLGGVENKQLVAGVGWPRRILFDVAAVGMILNHRVITEPWLLMVKMIPRPGARQKNHFPRDRSRHLGQIGEFFLLPGDPILEFFPAKREPVQLFL